jgi:hypothetical protein
LRTTVLAVAELKSELAQKVALPSLQVSLEDVSFSMFCDEVRQIAAESRQQVRQHSVVCVST